MSYLQVIATSTDDCLIITLTDAWVIIKVSGHQYRWLADGYDLEIGHFLEVASMVVTWWIVDFLCSDKHNVYNFCCKLMCCKMTSHYDLKLWFHCIYVIYVHTS